MQSPDTGDRKGRPYGMPGVPSYAAQARSTTYACSAVGDALVASRPEFMQSRDTGDRKGRPYGMPGVSS